MTNEEAIKTLKRKIDGHTDTSYEWVETVRMAIKALEQQPCDDCISRDELKRVISALTYWHPTTDGRLEVGGAFDNTVYKVEDVWRLTRKLPSVTPQPKTGHWEDCSNGWMCSSCGRDVSHESDFCLTVGQR